MLWGIVKAPYKYRIISLLLLLLLSCNLQLLFKVNATIPLTAFDMLVRSR